MKGTIFFCCSCAIVILSMINLSVGPIVKKKVDITPIYVTRIYATHISVRTKGNTWGTYNCKLLSDYYDTYEETHSLSDNARKYDFEWPINECERKKAMHDMEYTSFILNIIFGMICGLLGLFHLFDLKNEFISKTGLIGLGCGFVGFIFSFIYVVYNGIVYTNYFDTGVVKRDGGGVYAEKIPDTSDQFKCLYYDEPYNFYSVFAKFSELNQKQYNYDKDIYKSVDPDCVNDIYAARCSQQEIITVSALPTTCENLYAEEIMDFKNKDKSDRFLTTLILSLFVCLADLGLALFGFLLYRTPGEF